MPVTFVAHQSPALALKVWKPRWFDATALCVGTMAPDLLYAVSDAANVDSHRWLPALAIGLPLSVVATLLIRFAVAPELAPLLPDLGPFRFRSYAVIGSRRPAASQTVGSACIGIATHLVIDGFTHPGRFGPRALGYDDISVTIAGITRPLAGVFQWVGHLGGSILAVGLLLHIGRHRLLDRWYGAEVVGWARAARPGTRRRVVAVVGLVGGATIGLRWGWNAERIETIQRFAVGLFLGLATTAVALRVHRELRARSGSPADMTGPDVATCVSLGTTLLLSFTTAHLLAAAAPATPIKRWWAPPSRPSAQS
jgi:hypothetical protein